MSDLAQFSHGASNEVEHLGAIYDAAWKNAPPSIGMDILADHLGFLLMDILGD